MEETKKDNKYNEAKWWQIFMFSTSDAATNSVFIAMSLVFLLYCTDYYGLSTLVVGAIMVGTRILDAITDPIIGVMVDRTDTRIGKFRPWILMGSLIISISFFIIFQGFDFGNNIVNTIFITIMYCIFIIGYTFQCTVTKSAQTILTNKPKQRTNLNALAMIFTMTIYVIINSIAGTVDDYAIKDSAGEILVSGYASLEFWQVIATTIVGIQLVLSLSSFIGISKKDKPEFYNVGPKNGNDEENRAKVKDYIEVFKRNRALRSLIVAASTNKFASNAISSLTLLFYVYVVKDSSMISEVSMLTLPFTILGIFGAVAITNRLGRRMTMSVTSVAAATFGILAVIILATVGDIGLVLLVVVLGINGLLGQLTNMNIMPMIADCADYEVYEGGKFVPGMIGTAFSFIDKVISAIGSGVASVFLFILGFTNVTDTPVSSKMFWGVLTFYFLIPSLGHIASVIAMKKYPITPELSEKMIAKRAESTNLES